MRLINLIKAVDFSFLNILSIILLAVLTNISCSVRFGDPQQLIRDLERNGIVLGKSTNLLERLKYEEIESLEEINPSIKCFSFYNGGLGIDKSDSLVFFSLINPAGKAKEERKHLTKLPVLAFNGKPIMDMSRRDFVQAYGQPSEIVEPNPIPSQDKTTDLRMMVYYYKDEENALTKVSIAFKAHDHQMENPIQLIVSYIEGKSAKHLIELGRFRVYNFPK